jgi:hypothetical protein
MKLNKTGIVFLITLMIVAGIIVPAVSAVENRPVGETPGSDLKNPPMISFDGLSTPGSVKYNATELKIPSSIKKYELLTFDIPKMREKLANNETITVRINGVPYAMNLRDSTGKAEGLDPTIHSYRGSLKTKNSEIVLTISDKVLLGWIMLNGINYHIGVSPTKENEKSIEYVYSSTDVVSHECIGCLENDYLAYADITTVRTNESPTVPPVTTTQQASLPFIIPLSALGLVILRIWN